MRAKDKALRRYLTDNKVIADIFSIAFGADGLSVDPADLRDLDSVQVMGMPMEGMASDTKGRRLTEAFRERTHDSVKGLETTMGGRSNLFILNVEGQTRMSPVMPLRMLQYEDHSMTFMAERMAAAVKSGGRPGDWLSGWPEGAVLPSPLSVTLYTGKGDWTGPRSLRELQGNIPEALSRRMTNVPLNVLTFKDICKYDPDSLLSDIGVVAAYIFYEKDSDKLKELIETKEKFHHLSRNGFDVINTHRKLAITIPEDTEEIDMHYAEQVWANKAKAEGINIGEERGIKLGEERGIKLGEEEERRKGIGNLIKGLREVGVSSEKIVSQLIRLYHLSRNEALVRLTESKG